MPINVLIYSRLRVPEVHAGSRMAFLHRLTHLSLTSVVAIEPADIRAHPTMGFEQDRYLLMVNFTDQAELVIAFEPRNAPSQIDV